MPCGAGYPLLMTARPALAALLSVSAIAVAITGAAQAQTPPPASDTPITVEGRRAEQVERARDYVRRIAVAPGERSLARWVDRVCPRIVGLGPEQAAHVEHRIRVIAASVDAPLADAPCDANFTVVFSGDGAGLLTRLTITNPSQFNRLDRTTIDALTDGRRNVRWWHMVQTRSSDNMPESEVQPPHVGADGAAPVMPTGIPYTRSERPSMISTNSIRAILAATIVIDRNDTAGMTLDSLAAFAAVAGLSEVTMDETPPVPSILQLFDPAMPASEYSEFDAAFLRALYRIPLDRRARYQRARLARDLIANLPDGE